MLSPQKEMTLIQCMRVYDEWRVSPDTVLKEKMEDRSLCIISSTNGEIMLTYAPVCVWNFLLAQLVRKPPAMWETSVRSLDWEDPLEKGKAPRSGILACRIPWPV